MRKLIVLFLVFSFLHGHATKKSYLDSVAHVVDTTKSIREKIASLYILSYEYGLIQPEQGIKYGFTCLKLAQSIHDLTSQLNAYNGIGNSYETLGNYDSALFYHFKSHEIAKQSGSKFNLAATLFNVGNCYKELGNYKKALSMYLKGYSLLENEKDYNPRLHFYLSEIYLKLNQNNDAAFHARKGIRLTKRTGQDYIGYSIQVNLAKSLFQENKPDSAIFLLEEALTGLKKHTDQASIAYCLNALGEIQMALGNYKKATSYLLEELELNKNYSNKNGICIASLNLALCYAFLNDYKEAIKFITVGLEHLKYVQHNKDILMKAYKKASDAYKRIGQDKDALIYFEKHIALKDSIIGVENLNQINALEAKYALTKKENRIREQELKLEKQKLQIARNRTLLISAIIAFGTLFISGILYYRNYKTKQKLILENEIQHQRNLREIALKEKENEERLRIARNIHDDLGSGISKIFLIAENILPEIKDNPELTESVTRLSKTAKTLAENMKDLVWTLDPENSYLENFTSRIIEYSSEYLEDFNLETRYEIDPGIPHLSISKEAQRNMFLAFKESLNNVVKHANATQIRIGVQFKENRFIIIVNDNGKGFDATHIKTTSNGLKNMAVRMQNINGTFNLNSTPHGTAVEFSIPFAANQ